jgi:hypothetical protein
MFNPEKLLGGLISSGMGGGKSSGLLSGGMGLGLLGLAMEAVDHFMNQPSKSSPPPPLGASPPPLPPGPGRQPPALHGAAPAPPPPPPGTVCAATGSSVADPQQEAVVLIRAMIAAANADGVIDAKERAAILERLKTAALSAEEHQFIVHELLAPQDTDQIVAAVTSPAMAAKVYTVSVLAIDVDTEAERTYLQTLARRLNLDAAATGAIHQQCGLEPL